MKLQAIVRGVLPKLFLLLTLWLTVSTTVEATISSRTSNPTGSTTSLIADNSGSCDHIIGRQVGTADGRTNYSNVKPGDTVCLEAGTRNRLKLYNFTGTPQEPIIFMNFGGQVFFNQSSDFAILIKNSRYFRLTGSGVSGYEYGIKIEGNYLIGVNAGWKSSDMQFDHIEVSHANVSGIMANTKATCSDGSDNTYDYDGDGIIKYDLDDVVAKQNFIQYNTVLHHNYVHDTHSEGFYIGNNRTVYASYGYFGPGPCPSSPTYPLNPVLNGVLIHSNVFERVGWESINVKGTIDNCRVYNNEIYQGSTQGYSDQVGDINLSLNSHCDVYSNYIKDAYGPGIRSTGTGGKIYNNIIINPGRGYTSSDNYGSGVYIFLGTEHKGFYIWNNTIVEPRSFGIRFDYKYGSDNRIQNNIIVNPGQPGDGGYISVSSQAEAMVSHNLTRRDIAEMKFVNPITSDYSLLSDSPAVDQGVDLSSQGVNVDYLSVARPQGSRYDIGAFESVPQIPDTPTSTPTPTNTPTILPTITTTPTSTPTSLPTATPVPTNTPTPSPTYTLTPTPTDRPSPTYTPTAPPTDTPTMILSSTPTPTDTPTPIPATETPTASLIDTPTVTPSATLMPTNIPTPTPTATTTSPLPPRTPFPTFTPTSQPTATPLSFQLTIDEPVYAGSSIVTGKGVPGKTVVIRVLGNASASSTGEVDEHGRYVVDLTTVLQARGTDGLEAHDIIQAEMGEQICQAIVQVPILKEGSQIFLPIVIR